MNTRSTSYSIRFVQFETRQREVGEWLATRELARRARTPSRSTIAARLRALASR